MFQNMTQSWSLAPSPFPSIRLSSAARLLNTAGGTSRVGEERQPPPLKVKNLPYLNVKTLYEIYKPTLNLLSTV